jgi:hypothetical protein
MSRAVEQEEAGDAVDDNDMMAMLRSWHSRGLVVD